MLYLVRHGQTEFNVQERIQGLCDSGLTEKGRVDAAKLAKALADVDFKEVYASTLGRAIQTAEIVQGSRGLPVHSLPELNEMGFGIWEGRTVTELKQIGAGDLADYRYHPQNYLPPEGGQSFAEMFKQVEKAGRFLFERAKNQDILAVSHGACIKAFCCFWQGKKIDEVWEPPLIENTGLTLIDCSGERPKFVLIGDLKHLQDK